MGLGGGLCPDGLRFVPGLAHARGNPWPYDGPDYFRRSTGLERALAGSFLPDETSFHLIRGTVGSLDVCVGDGDLLLLHNRDRFLFAGSRDGLGFVRVLFELYPDQHQRGADCHKPYVNQISGGGFGPGRRPAS